MISRYDKVIDDVMTNGWAKVLLCDEHQTALEELIGAARVFFARGTSRNLDHVSPAGDHGFRAVGMEYSITPDRPDVNESLSLWSDRLDLIPSAAQLGAVGPALLRWQAIISKITADILVGLAARFDAASPPAFAAASSVQVNHYLSAGSDRACLQDRHEDGHMLTLVHGTAAGLELILDDVPVPVTTTPDELVAMPGSVMTDLTAGAVAPLYHQVRNLQLPMRQSVMYFVNPQLDAPLRRWVDDDGTDLRESVRQRPAAFGLPVVPFVE